MFDEKEKLKGDKKLPLHELIRRNLYYIKDEKRNFILAIVFLFIIVLTSLKLSLTHIKTFWNYILLINLIYYSHYF